MAASETVAVAALATQSAVVASEAARTAAGSVAQSPWIWDSSMQWLLSIVSGIVASVIVLLGDRTLTRLSLRRKFSGLAGTYEQLRIDGTPYCDSDGTVRTTTLRYVGEATLETSSETEGGKWTGRIKMDPALPSVGMGSYVYAKDGAESGLHQIQVLDDDRLLVHVVSLSHVNIGRFALVWRRVRVGDLPNNGIERTPSALD